MADSKRQNDLPPEELALFCEQIAMILKAGIPLRDAMETLRESYGQTRYGARFIRMEKDVQNSGSLHAALAAAGIFPQYMVGMVRIGEATGKLDDVMRALSTYYNWEADVERSVRNAILYPAVLVLMMAVVVAILVISVLPVFGRVFESLGADAGAGSLMSAGMIAGRVVLLLIGLCLLALIACLILARSRRRDALIDGICRIFPAVRTAREKIAAGRFAWVTHIMLESGYSLDDAMPLVAEIAEDRRSRLAIRQCGEKVKNGVPFASALEETGLFSELHIKMVQVGAAAGQLDGVMARLTEIYRAEADERIRRIVTMIEPILVAVLAVVIGGIMLSVMLPLLSILSSMA